MSKRPNVQKTKCPKDQMSKRPNVQKNKGQKVQVSESPNVKKAKCLEVHLYQRPNVQKSKYPKDQMSTRPNVFRPRVQRPQVYLPPVKPTKKKQSTKVSHKIHSPYVFFSLIKPQITFDKKLQNLSFAVLMKNHSLGIGPGIQLGKENGLTLLMDAEVYDYAFSPQKGEGFKVAIHSHLDQPIMALSDIDLSPGFVTQLSVTPILRDTTDQAKWRFSPEERGCYFDGELEFQYLPSSLYRYSLTNCLFAATYDEILEKCQCVPFFHTLAYEDYPRICAGPQLLCMNDILRDIGSHTHVRTKDDAGNILLKRCLFACK